MPKRETTYTVNSEKVQGRESWVELSYLTYGEFQAILTDAIKPSDILASHVLNWNWVDGQGQELGRPTECLDALFSHEREFLLSALYNPSENNLKN